MGEHSVELPSDKAQVREFMQHLFKDVKALEIMIHRKMFEEGITRMGAEQELCLIDRSFRPIPSALDVLKELNDEHFTTELALFNLEANLDPLELTGNCLSKAEQQLTRLLKKLGDVTQKFGQDYIMVGILPTIRWSDLRINNITPFPRYHALNEAISRMRGGTFSFRISGVDELVAQDDTVMLESCNTSFQTHYQVSPKDFTKMYNWAQAITGPCLAASTNSPFLLGKRLWRETRIALFQQSTDTQGNADHVREYLPRVHFGSQWLNGTVVDLFKESIARYRALITMPIESDSIDALERGETPKLQALRIHNGTVYKWNRACYGISDNGKPHLRIENRIFPSGPTVIDEMANFAFWLGLMNGIPPKYGRLNKTADFDAAKTNFLRTARMGMGAMFRWVDDQVYSAQDLLLKELLPLAQSGLEKANINPRDINHYLKVIEERVASGKTGSQWQVDSFLSLQKKGTREEAIVALTAGIVKRQKTNKPVHKWALARINEAGNWINRYWRVDQIMSRDLFTVQEDDLIDMVINMMNWRGIRHILVENDRGELVGLVTSTGLIKYYSTRLGENKEQAFVKDIMTTKMITIDDEMLTTDAISLMRKHEIGCLPVINNGKLVGIVTERDFVNVADHILQEYRDAEDKK